MASYTALSAILVVLLCAPAQAQDPGATGDQYAPEPCPAPDPGACADAAVGDAASVAAGSTSEGSRSVNRAVSADGPVAGGAPEAGVPVEAAGSPPPNGPSSVAGGGGGPSVLPETGGPPPLVPCVGAMLVGLLALRAAR